MNTIDAKPYDFELASHPPALIIIDMQKDFLIEGGFGSVLGNDVRPLSKIIPAVAALLNCFRQLNLPVIHTREAHRADMSDCPESKRLRGKGQLKIGDNGPMGRILIDGEEGNQIVDELKPIAGELEIVKPGKGAFYATPLSEFLRCKNISQLIITGVTTEVCVQTTMREANDRGYDCLLVEDGTESYFPQFKQATLDMIVAQGGIVGWTAQSNTVIQALERTYG